MKTHLRIFILTSLLLAPCSMPHLFAQGGALTPPGAPGVLFKTLHEVEPRTPISSLPFTISAGGSYYLTGNLTALPSGNGITINASHVTLDLNGFALVGNAGTATYGVRVNNTRTNVVIRNGTVRNWNGSGVMVEAITVLDVRVEKVRAVLNGSTGISLGGMSVAVDCVANNNFFHGIASGTACMVLRCTAISNAGGGDGINVGTRSTVRECVATGNNGDGIQTGDDSEVGSCRVSANTGNGANCGDGCVVRDCTADGNTLAGFLTLTECVVQACAARANFSIGIDVGTGSTVTACSANVNTVGINVGAGSKVSDCSAIFNSGVSGIHLASHCTASGCIVNLNTSNATSSQGIFGSAGCLIIHCTVGDTASTAATLTSSTGAGIVVGNGSKVQDCTVRNNSGDGIRAATDASIVGNQCETNGLSTGTGAGIHITQTGNRIDGNHVVGNDRGIDVDNQANTIVRNTASGNTVNYDIAANNSIGAIVIPGNSVAINTNVGQASSLGTTDPWANFSE